MQCTACTLKMAVVVYLHETYIFVYRISYIVIVYTQYIYENKIYEYNKIFLRTAEFTLDNSQLYCAMRLYSTS